MDVLKPGDIIEGFEIVSLLGKGAMGKVYLVKDKDSLYVIKETVVLNSSDEQSIAFKSSAREAELLKNIKHPGLPLFYKTFNYDNKLYIVMEYIEGESLEDIIRKAAEPLEERRVIYLAIQLCEIFFYLHTLRPEPVIYRDLKPSNVIITSNDIVRLIDFGVARRYDPAKDSDTTRLGTPGYAVPEQYRTKGQSTPRSDIYALGVLLHQLLTLHDPTVTPFKFPSVKSLNPSVSEQLDWIIKKAINPEPKDRYLDAGLFRGELIDYYNENFGVYISSYRRALPYESLSPVRKKTSRIMLPFVAGSLLVLVLGLFHYPNYHICFLPMIFLVLALYFLQREYED